jgi:8-oxo-dGTP diphosphatase
MMSDHKTSEKRLEVVCVIILDQHGNVLLAQRKDEQLLGGFWEFPGGKLEANESVEDCAVREIEEELNLKIEPLGVLSTQDWDYTWANIRLSPVVARCHDLDSMELRVHRDVKWFKNDSLSEVNADEIAPADRPILNEWLAVQGHWQCRLK